MDDKWSYVCPEDRDDCPVSQYDVCHVPHMSVRGLRKLKRAPSSIPLDFQLTPECWHIIGFWTNYKDNAKLDRLILKSFLSVLAVIPVRGALLDVPKDFEDFWSLRFRQLQVSWRLACWRFARVSVLALVAGCRIKLKMNYVTRCLFGIVIAYSHVGWPTTMKQRP